MALTWHSPNPLPPRPASSKLLKPNISNAFSVHSVLKHPRKFITLTKPLYLQTYLRLKVLHGPRIHLTLNLFLLSS